MVEHYRPSCGTEGMDFQESFCEQCTRNRSGAHDGGCKILLLTLIHGVEDADYPPEWRYDESGAPTCTAFKNKADRKPRGPNKKKAHGTLLSQESQP